MLPSWGPRALSADNLPPSDLCRCKTNHLGLCNLRHAIERKPAILLGFRKYPLLINALRDTADADLKAGLTQQLPGEWRTVRWWNQRQMGQTAPSPGPVNHKLIYAKQENKLCAHRSISHPVSASEELQLTSTPRAVWPRYRTFKNTHNRNGSNSTRVRADRIQGCWIPPGK